jgi:hypothetical protein
LAKRKVGGAVKQVPLTEFKDAPVVRRLKEIPVHFKSASWSSKA